MLPFLRIVPIGGVCLTALVLVLALEPPGKPPRAVSPDMALARGSLIDRTAHPEWPQMLVRAAYRRADEILKLRDLPNTPTLVAPVVLPPQRPAIVARPAPVVATPQAPADQTAAPSSPQPVTQAATLPANVDIAKPAAVTPPSPPVASAPAAATLHPVNKISADSKNEAKAETAATAPAPTAAANAPAPKAATAPAPTATVVAAPMPATDAVPVPEPKPTKLAALPIERPASQPTSDDVTGAIADSSSATMPVDIGEASSTELPIVLPRERPVRLRVRRRGEERRRVEPHHRVKAKAKPKPKPRLPRNVQPASQVNLFDQLFDNSSAAKTQAAGPRTRGAKPPPTRQSTATNNLSPPAPYDQFDVR